jgi:hypothetical protein
MACAPLDLRDKNMSELWELDQENSDQLTNMTLDFESFERYQTLLVYRYQIRVRMNELDEIAWQEFKAAGPNWRESCHAPN